MEISQIAQKKSSIVDALNTGSRLDVFLAHAFSDYSRSFFKNLITQGNVVVNQQPQKKAGFLVSTDDEVSVLIPDFLAQKQQQDLSFIDAKILYMHNDFFIVYKGPGVLVHTPTSKCDQITLVDWLIQKHKDLIGIGHPERPGIVHRLDMNTSGVMIIPRTNFAHKIVGDMFKERRIKKTYRALVEGHPDKEGVIDTGIIRNPIIRTRMTHVPHHDAHLPLYANARNACTRYRVLEYFTKHSLVEVFPVTGRTHQIRVHFVSIGHPILGDTVYGSVSPLIERQALHAQQLAFDYNGQSFCFEHDAPDDFQRALKLVNKTIEPT